MIPGYERRDLVETQLGALERELRGHIRDERHRAAIQAQIKVFATELERMEREGDEEPEPPPRSGRFAWIAPSGHEWVAWRTSTRRTSLLAPRRWGRTSKRPLLCALPSPFRCAERS